MVNEYLLGKNPHATKRKTRLGLEQRQSTPLIVCNNRVIRTLFMVLVSIRGRLMRPLPNAYMNRNHQIPSIFFERLNVLIRETPKGTLNDFSRITGFSSGALSKILNGQTSFSLDRLYSIFHAYPDLNPSWLLFGEGPRERISAEQWSTMEARQLSLEDANVRLEAKVEALQELLGMFQQQKPQ